jgi:N-methylhydantoinase A
VELNATGEPAGLTPATRDAYDAAIGDRVATAVLNRSELAIGAKINGPAIIAESQTTTVLGSHHRCTVQPDGSLLIGRIQSEGVRR